MQHFVHLISFCILPFPLFALGKLFGRVANVLDYTDANQWLSRRSLRPVVIHSLPYM
jgi:hypothetical protein